MEAWRAFNLNWKDGEQSFRQFTMPVISQVFLLVALLKKAKLLNDTAAGTVLMMMARLLASVDFVGWSVQLYVVALRGGKQMGRGIEAIPWII